jgi:hypothetical protein
MIVVIIIQEKECNEIYKYVYIYDIFIHIYIYIYTLRGDQYKLIPLSWHQDALKKVTNS